MYCTYLQNTKPGHHKHYFVAVDGDAVSGWMVRVAWGRIGTIFSEKTYNGGKSGAFLTENNAEAYARAIVKSKISEGYTTEWSGRMPWPALDTGDDYDGEEPMWWSDAGSRPVAKHAASGSSATPKASTVSELKRKLRALDDDDDEKPKVKGKTVADDDDEKPLVKTKTSTKEEHHGTRRPRIQITPRR